MNNLKRTVVLVILLLITSGFLLKKTYKQKAKNMKATITYYAHRYDGRKTASGEKFSERGMTCATNNKKYFGHDIFFMSDCDTIKVKCNDLMANDKKLRFDLTEKAFQLFNNGSLNKGVMKLEFAIAQ